MFGLFLVLSRFFLFGFLFGLQSFQLFVLGFIIFAAGIFLLQYRKQFFSFTRLGGRLFVDSPPVLFATL